MTLPPPERPLQLAAIVTAYYALSHADVIVSRWLEPRATDAARGWPPPGPRRTAIASLHIVPSPHDHGSPERPDVGLELATRHGVTICQSIEEALTLGTDGIAVDGVLLIGEHGNYPLNDLGQKLYPRFELFEAITGVLGRHGKVVPLFLDKHWSYDNHRVVEMEGLITALGMPFLAGSSLPHCPFQPAIATPGRVRESVSLFYGGAEAYGFHSLEVAQAVLEKRIGGEADIVRLGVWEDAASLEDLDEDLVAAALKVPAAKASTLTASGSSVMQCLKGALAYRVEFADGVRSTHLLLDNHVPEFVLAVRDGGGTIQAGRVDGGNADDFYGHFASLNVAIEELMVTHKTPVPRKRTMLTSLVINALMEVRQNAPGKWVPWTQT